MSGRRLSLFWAACVVAGALLVAFVVLPAASMVVGAGAGLLGEALRQDDIRRSLWLTVSAALIATAIAFVVAGSIARASLPRAWPLSLSRTRWKA